MVKIYENLNKMNKEKDNTDLSNAKSSIPRAHNRHCPSFIAAAAAEAHLSTETDTTELMSVSGICAASSRIQGRINAPPPVRGGGETWS